MSIVQPSYPDINGHRYSFSSIELSFLKLPLGIQIALQSVDYDDTLTPGKLKGKSPQTIGRTRGKYEATASITLPFVEHANLVAALGQLGAAQGLGYKEVAFDIQLQYADALQPVLTDLIRGCRLTKGGHSYKNEEGVLTVKQDLDPLYLVKNGQYPFFAGTGGVFLP
ncbi:MAG TPA: hypothetical protein VMB50_20830 [Myxococcales bacterium]|nr:hypothetical protein [Myxococcales bacterium]